MFYIPTRTMANDVYTKELDEYFKLKSFQEPYDNAKNDFERRLILKGFYSHYTKRIIDNKGVADVYMLGDSTMKHMTPIEQMFFRLTRTIGRCYLFPEYPVGNYFVDFGNPFHKIAVECDGKEWHDSEKDRLRDIELHKMGWIVFRLSGSDLFKDETEEIQEFEDEIKERCLCDKLDFEKTMLWEMSGKIYTMPTLLVKMLRYVYFEKNTWSRWYKVFLCGEFQTKIYR